MKLVNRAARNCRKVHTGSHQRIRPYFNYRGPEIALAQGMEDIDPLSVVLLEGNVGKVYEHIMRPDFTGVRIKNFELAKWSGNATSMLVPLSAVAPHFNYMTNHHLFNFWQTYGQNMPEHHRDWLFGQIVKIAASHRDLDLVEKAMSRDTDYFLDNDDRAYLLMHTSYVSALKTSGIDKYPATRSAIEYLGYKYYSDPLVAIRETETQVSPMCTNWRYCECRQTTSLASHNLLTS